MAERGFEKMRWRRQIGGTRYWHDRYGSGTGRKTMKDGQFVWYELITSDVAAARDFYARVVGWTVEDTRMPGMTYLLAKVGEQEIGGLMGFPPDMPDPKPVWMGYVLASDVDGTAKRVTEAGGAIYREPADIPGVGRFAVVADPQGAAFMLFHGDGDAMPALPYMTPGTVGWHELHSSDWPAGFAFYETLFGWTRDAAIEIGPMGTYQLFATGTHAIGGMMTGYEPAPSPYWIYYFAIDDIDAATARVTEAGGSILYGPVEVPGGMWVINAIDPQGAVFALVGKRG
jgi:predicted enzyme related to lactoylglutathione lyase